MDRQIIHLNVADFAVAVERVLDARLRARPVLIAPEAAARAAVFDMSEEAYRAGVRKGMSLMQARGLCRDALVLPPRLERYEHAMRALLERALPYSPLIEWVDENGHLFVDVSGTGRLFGPPADVAWRIRKAVRWDLGLDPIWSVAPNKLVAKAASRLVKPLGEYIVEAGEEEAFLRPLPLRLLPGLEMEDLLRLREFHLRLVGEAARLTLPQLEVLFPAGLRARQFFDTLRGVDASPVLPVGARRPVVSVDHEFGWGLGGLVSRRPRTDPRLPLSPPSPPPPNRSPASPPQAPVVHASPLEGDTNDAAAVEGALYHLTERGGAELRRRRLAARRIGVVLDYADGIRVARQATAETATANDFRLFDLAQVALGRAWTRRVRVRHLRLSCDRLVFPPAQTDLFPEDDARTRREERLVAALDAIRAKFGEKAIQSGRTLAS